ncbi:hypothetical protein [Azospirillum palustre]
MSVYASGSAALCFATGTMTVVRIQRRVLKSELTVRVRVWHRL